MDQQALDLAKNAARASVTNAGIFAGVYFIIDVLSKIPLVGALFFCLKALLSLAAFFAIAYLATPKLLPFPPNQTKAMLALYIGGGVAAVVTVAFLIITLIDGVIALIIGAALGGSESAFSSAVGGVGTLIVRLIGSLVFGLIVGTLLAFLGSYVAFDRNKDMQQIARPF
jgi:hypothetical protein